MSRALALALLIACGGGNPEVPTEAGVPDTQVPDADAPDQGDVEPALLVPSGVDVMESALLEVRGLEPPFDWQVGGETFSSESARIERRFAEPGRVVVRVQGRSSAALVESFPVTQAIDFEPSSGATLARLGPRIAATLTDDGALVLATFAEGAFAERRRVSVCAEPVAVLAAEERFWVACARDAQVVAIDPDSAEVLERIDFARGSRPHGLAFVGGELLVALQGLGQVVRRSGDVVASLPDVRALAATPSGFVAARFRSPDARGELVWFDATPTERALAFDPQPSADTESGGVPTLLAAISVSTTDARVYVAGQQANIGEGTFINGIPLTFETTVRGAVRVIDREDGRERFDERFVFDNRGRTVHASLSARSDYLYVLDQGHRSVERIDTFSSQIVGTVLDVGFGATGVLAWDDMFFVNAETSRELRAYNVDAQGRAEPIATLPLVDREPLDPQVLRGKQLFEDAFDPRLARDGYIACAACHPAGDSDHRVWDFTNRGEGLRRTPALFGRAQDGPLHWTGNFDELQDFELDIRLHFGGLGLMDSEDFIETRDPFGPPKAGRSEELDALAAYMVFLSDDLTPPEQDGASVARGRALFDGSGCATCHSGPRYTDSRVEDGAPRLHDVGTLSAGSGQRASEPLEGIDTPTLIGLWHSPRFLHDGSAETLEQVFRERNPEGRHGGPFSDDELSDLVAFLRSL